MKSVLGKMLSDQESTIVKSQNVMQPKVGTPYLNSDFIAVPHFNFAFQIFAPLSQDQGSFLMSLARKSSIIQVHLRFFDLKKDILFK